MKIERIDITRHRLDLDPPFAASWDSRPRAAFEASIVRVVTDEGLVGIASGDSMAGFEAHADLFVGQDPLDIDRHYRVLDNLAFHYGRYWPLDVALWDLRGKIQGKPVWKLLGGRADRVRAYASTGMLRSPEGMADQAERIVARGFGAMKLRFHRDAWREDVAALGAVRTRIGDKLELMVDCNQGWRMPWDTSKPWRFGVALEVARALDAQRVHWMEEPLHRSDYAGMARLRRESNLKIAGGEMNREIFEYMTLMERGCLDVYQPDCVLTGGITGLREVAAQARKLELTFTPHTWSNGIGLIANLHLAAGIHPPAWIEFPFDPPEWSTARRDFMLANPIEPDAEGWLTLSDAPGLGIELDEDRLKATRVN